MMNHGANRFKANCFSGWKAAQLGAVLYLDFVCSPDSSGCHGLGPGQQGDVPVAPLATAGGGS